MNPDCVAGKHTACAGDAWDEQADALTSCACSCHVTPADLYRAALARETDERDLSFLDRLDGLDTRR